MQATDSVQVIYSEHAPPTWQRAFHTDLGPQLRADAMASVANPTINQTDARGAVISSEKELTKKQFKGKFEKNLAGQISDASKDGRVTIAKSSASDAGVYHMIDQPYDRSRARGVSRRAEFIANRQAGNRPFGFRPQATDEKAAQMFPRGKIVPGDIRHIEPGVEGWKTGLDWRKGTGMIEWDRPFIMPAAKADTTRPIPNVTEKQFPTRSLDNSAEMKLGHHKRIDFHLGQAVKKGLLRDDAIGYVEKRVPGASKHLVSTKHAGRAGGKVVTEAPAGVGAKALKGAARTKFVWKALPVVGVGIDLFQAGADVGRGNWQGAVGHVADAALGATIVGDVFNIAASTQGEEGAGSALVDAFAESDFAKEAGRIWDDIWD